MPPVEHLLAHLDELLAPGEWDDLGPNGLQVPGVAETDVVATAVSSHLATLTQAVEAGAGLLVVHHGLLWDFLPRRLSPVMAERLRLVLGARLNVAMYHLPLDAHPEHGNNALLAEALGAGERRPFGRYRGRAVGVAARFPGEGVPVAELRARVATATGREPLVFDAGPDPVRTIGIVSGAAASTFPEAVAEGLDAFLTGEPAEHVMGDARDAGVHFVAAGHYATETFGVRRLGDLLAERFGVRHVAIDVPNPV